ncbi:MAG: ATPase [Bacteroidetes bacterium]|jgi:uncharacterized protein YndB with AHSA1/START domain|nr:ATPase [Bacteroidota bacterium]
MKGLSSYPSIRIKQIYSCCPSEVWKAISDENALKKWFFPVENYSFQEGKEFSFWTGEDPYLTFHKCRFLFIEPLNTIEYSWELPNDSKGISIVRWEISEEDGKTLLTFTHDGIAHLSDARFRIDYEYFSKKWNHLILNSLCEYLYKNLAVIDVLY